MITRPTGAEHDPAFSRYITRVPEGNFFDVFQSQTQKTIGLFETFSEEKGNYSYAPGKWSLKEVLGHVIDFERVFSYRTLCIARGEQQSLPAFDENEYARNAGYDRLELSKVIEHYKKLRNSTICLLEQIPDDAWTRTGVSNQKPVSARALAYTMAGHELHHMNVISERYL